jgi:tetrahydromethanopterin S-methyltransferase subunit D
MLYTAPDIGCGAKPPVCVVSGLAGTGVGAEGGCIHYEHPRKVSIRVYSELPPESTVNKITLEVTTVFLIC